MTRRAWIITGGSLALAGVRAIALVVVIATDDDDSGASASGSPPASVQFGGQLPPDVQGCLSQKGIEPPQPGQPPSGETDPQKLRQALEDCGVAPPSGTVRLTPGPSGSG